MSLVIMPEDMSGQPARKRRSRRQQIPSLVVTEGRAEGLARIAKPPRRAGKGGTTYAERRRVQDEQIEKLDAECRPRWEIAAAVGLKQRQIYYRLKRLRERRMLYRAVRDVMDDTTLYG